MDTVVYAYAIVWTREESDISNAALHIVQQDLFVTACSGEHTKRWKVTIVESQTQKVHHPLKKVYCISAGHMTWDSSKTLN